ncbi:MAG: putative sulfate exporter family transporter [Actinobacteria bacterium]|nr:putative sulfate exporter family transporter [Actinomycetota bacterium]
MESMQLTPPATLPARLGRRGAEVVPGAILCAGIAVVATLIAVGVPVIGSAIPAIVIGVLIRLLWTPPARLLPGIGYASKFVLQLAVVLLGAQLSLESIVKVGAESFPVMVCSLTVCLLGAWLIGRAMGVDREMRVLIGVGTGICGASAIAGVSPVIRARSASISYAVSTVFLFNVIAVAAFPAIGHLFGMSPHAFGLFAGTAVNDTSSVVAAASVFSAASLGFAVVVKLVRTLMIIPISIALSLMETRRAAADQAAARRAARSGNSGSGSGSAGSGTLLTPARILRLVPWFLFGFLIVAVIASTGALPDATVTGITHVSVFLVTTAMAGIGLSTDLQAIRSSGWRPLALGGVLSVLVAGTTLAVMALTGII